MATQLQQAQKGVVTPQMEQVAADEGRTPEEIRQGVAAGHLVIPYNVHRSFRAVGIGAGLRTKVNANIGASGLRNLVEEEITKLAQEELGSSAEPEAQQALQNIMEQIAKIG